MLSSSPPALVVDRRQDPKFTRALGAHFTVTEKQLRTGDLVWSCPLGIVGVEDKCMADLAASLRNKRLDDELRRLVDTYAVPVLFIRGSAPYTDGFTHFEQDTLEKLKLGRQLHGVYVWQSRDVPLLAADSVKALYDYLATPKQGGIEGVRRERKYGFSGPLGPREEIIYTILGMTQGVRNRRMVATQIAEATPLSEFLNWTASDFTFVGFSAHMSIKLAGVIAKLEEHSSKSQTSNSIVTI